MRVLLLACLAIVAGCGNDGGPAHFTLKVVAEPQGKGASAACENMGDSTGGASGNNFFVGRWYEASSVNEDGETFYIVRITGDDGTIHSWRYDEGMARAGERIDDRYLDAHGETAVHISGIFAKVDRCDP
jgi:hypothetical protein